MATTPKVPTRYQLRVGTYNIHAGADVGRDVTRIAEDLKALDLDIVGLQEVDVCTKRSKLVDQLQAIADHAGYTFFRFAFCIDYQEGEYGTAILSKYPIIEYKTVKLKSNKFESRSVGCAKIEVNGEPINYFNTHLCVEDRFTRAQQIAQIAARIAEFEKDENDYIITGDFNTEVMIEFRVFPDHTLVNYGELKTFPKTQLAIDNIIISPHWQIEDYKMVETGHSDHNLLYAVLGKREYIPHIPPRRKSYNEIIFGKKI